MKAAKKTEAVVDKLREMKLCKASEKVRDGVKDQDEQHAGAGDA
ncbi:MAG: hypothetical protein ACETVZ_02395 [Phycisphaerae bacterium]